MKAKELIKLAKNGETTIRVVNIKPMPDYCYAQVGMIGILKYAVPLNNDIVIVKVDWDTHKSINFPLEQKDWCIDNNPDLPSTMREAGQYPKNGIEEIFLMIRNHSGFEVYENKDHKILMKAYKKSKTDMTYQSWLERLAINALATK